MAVAVLFFGALWTPLIGLFFGAGALRAREENRQLAPLPEMHGWRTNWFYFARQFTEYFHDHFGFRGSMITAQALLKVKLLGVSSSPDVVVGREGWLYYSGERSIDNYRGGWPFPPDQLTEWVQFFKSQNDWLARHGILLIVAIPPDKQTVYPEFLPSTIGKHTGPTRLDELDAAMKAAPEVCFLDLRATLLAAKTSNSELYHHTDSHWRSPGIYAGYRTILQSMAAKYPDLKPVPFTEPARTGNYTAGDLAKLLGLAAVWHEIPEEHPVSSLPTTVTKEGDLLFERPGGPGPTLMMMGDSFMYPLVYYLAPHFAKTAVFRRESVKPGLVEKYHPDIVLLEMVERKLNYPHQLWELN